MQVRESASAGETIGQTDPIEAALADALTRAAAAGEWSTAETLSRELQARREARAKVISIGTARAKRGAK